MKLGVVIISTVVFLSAAQYSQQEPSQETALSSSQVILKLVSSPLTGGTKNKLLHNKITTMSVKSVFSKQNKCSVDISRVKELEP